MKKRHAHKDNVLLVNITRLGDMLQATPTIAGIKQENPNATVSVLLEKQFEEVCASIPGVDHVISVDLGMTVRCLAREGEGIIDAYEYIGEVVDDLRNKNFDYCLNMSSSAYTALLLRMVGIERSGGWSSDDEGFRVIESDWARLFATSVFHQNREFNSLNLVDVFRCSADVEQHPNKLMLNVQPEALEYAQNLINSANFTNTGPLIAVQAGASQGKRQWSVERFVQTCKTLIDKYHARIILTGSKKELSIIEPIKAGINSNNVLVTAGNTNITQLAALLSKCDLLLTGDTGPMHLSAAVGTPVVAMFLASAYAYETGPYSEGNIILQPVISCGPCNPNKPCSRPDCHELIDPQALAELVYARAKGDVKSIPTGLVNPNNVTVYRSEFDQWGFCDLRALTNDNHDQWREYRNAYRKLWLDELGGYPQEAKSHGLKVVKNGFEHLEQVIKQAQAGKELINKLTNLIRDTSASSSSLGVVNKELAAVDRAIESIGFDSAPLGPISRMFIFGKENISGSDALQLASQMYGVYGDLERRAMKLNQYL